MLMELMYRFLFYNSKIQLVILILLDSGGLIPGIILLIPMMVQQLQYIKMV